MNNQGLVLLAAWAGWSALLAALLLVVLRRGARPGG
ncbi:MAG: hypothetical protein QOF39_1212 [Frankiales bacterium]|jgi:hypothetical protein|nr:hypothetical protein [Frankiales bacterium]